MSEREDSSGRSERGGTQVREDPFGLIISVLLFGYFGFFAGLSTVATSGGPTIPLFAFFMWSLRLSAIGFAVALALHLAKRTREATLVAGVVGVLSALAFLIAAAWDFADQRYVLAISPVLLLLFAAWNGYVSWGSLRAVLAARGR
jgi:hypothetical protein